MKKIYFLCLIVALILMAGYAIYPEIKLFVATRLTVSKPERFLKSVIPESWTISVEKNSVPALWSGNKECEFIKLENPSEEYSDSDGGFDYKAWHKFWFCPEDWNGKTPNISPEVQEYPAELICDCDDFKIFHLSLGQNSQKNLPERITLEFGKNKKFVSRSEAWAIDRVRAVPEVVEYELMLKSVGKDAAFMAQEDNTGFWSVQVLEIVKNDDGSSHTATFNWYRVDKKTGTVDKGI